MDLKRLMTVARLVAELGGVDGRTRLQKLVHLLGTRFPREFRHRFTLHYFGPFSSELAGDVDLLVSAKLVAEESPAAGGSYRYSVTSKKARAYIEEATESKPPKWVKLAQRLNLKDKQTLEALSTVVFLRNCPRPSGDSTQQDFYRLKPHLKRKFKTAVELADELFPVASP